MDVVGATPTFERLIRKAIQRYPSWYVKAARLNKVIASNAPEVKDQVAVYMHGSRDLYVWPGVGDLLQKAVGHELAHAVDDNFGQPHFFSSTPEWVKIHREQGYFDIQKYRDQPLEYFADCVTKIFMLGPQRFNSTNPNETTFIESWVFPVLRKEFEK